MPKMIALPVTLVENGREMSIEATIPSAAACAAPPARHSQLRDLDYSVVQQCMHCGLCLPTCPTYDATKQERNSPRGRIALMRSIADGRLEPTSTSADEMYFCLGCLACMTACPAGVDYADLFERARRGGGERRVADAEKKFHPLADVALVIHGPAAVAFARARRSTL